MALAEHMLLKLKEIGQYREQCLFSLLRQDAVGCLPAAAFGELPDQLLSAASTVGWLACLRLTQARVDAQLVPPLPMRNHPSALSTPMRAYAYKHSPRQGARERHLHS